MPQVFGTFLKALPMVEGQSERGYWSRQQFEVMTLDSNPKMVAFTLFGADRISLLNGLQPGSAVIVEYSPESREVNDRVFTDLMAYRIMVPQYQQRQATPAQQAPAPQMPAQQPMTQQQPMPQYQQQMPPFMQQQPQQQPLNPNTPQGAMQAALQQAGLVQGQQTIVNPLAHDASINQQMFN